MAGTLTLDEVNALVQTLVAGIRSGSNGDDRVFTLPEVAERTGFALDTLEHDCRAGVYEHTRKGRRIGMTSRQIALMVHRHATGGDLAQRPTPGDELAQVRESTLRSGANRRGRRPAA